MSFLAAAEGLETEGGCPPTARRATADDKNKLEMPYLRREPLAFGDVKWQSINGELAMMMNTPSNLEVSPFVPSICPPSHRMYIIINNVVMYVCVKVGCSRKKSSRT